MKKRLVVLFVLLLAAGIFVLTGYYHDETSQILGYGTIEAREIHVGSRIGGRIAKMHKKEGSALQANDVIVELDAREIKAQEAEVKAAYASAKASLEELLAGYRPELIEKAQARVKEQLEYLKKLKAGPLPDEIQAQEARVKTAEADYEHASRSYSRLLGQAEQKIISEQDKDNALRAMNMAREKLFTEKKNYDLLRAGTRSEDVEIAAARLIQAQAELKQLAAGPRKEEVDRGKALIEEMEAKLQRLRIQQEECYISTPVAGQLEVCDLEVGDILAAGRTAATVLKPNDLWVRIYIKEHDLHRVHIGQQVDVVAERSKRTQFRSVFLNLLFSWFTPPTEIKLYQGEIVHIATEAEFTPRNVQTKEERGNQVFGVKVEIRNPEYLRPGMSAMVQEKRLEQGKTQGGKRE